MKPVVITIQKDAEGYIKLTEDQFKKYIQEAYESGYNDRQNYYFTVPNMRRDFDINPTVNTKIDSRDMPVSDKATIVNNKYVE